MTKKILLYYLFTALVLGMNFNQNGEILSFIFLVSQYLIGLSIIKNISKGFFVYDLRFLLHNVLFLYSVFYPLLIVTDIFQANYENIIATILYGSSLLGLNLAYLINGKVLNLRSINFPTNNKNQSLSLFLFSFLIFSFVLNLNSKGIKIGQLGEINRLELFKSVSQLWIVLVMLINALAIYLIYNYQNLRRTQRILFISFTLFYVYVHIQLGNRRDYLPIFIMTISTLYMLRKKSIDVKLIFISIFIFFASFWITLQRDQATYSLDRNEKIALAYRSNEFVYPFQTLYYTIKNDWDKRLGATYVFRPFQIFIPRTLYPSKPSTLGSEFVQKTFGKGYQGFAYTPTTEAYLNFGLLGPFLIFLVIGLSINRLYTYSNSQNNWIYYLIFSALVFDFCRSDFASFFYQTTVIVMAVLFQKINRRGELIF